jgi:hypothetical protein
MRQATATIFGLMVGLLVLLSVRQAYADDVQNLQRNEVVLVLDTSGSMGQPEWDQTDEHGNVVCRFPTSDPERLAVLGALILDGLTQGSSDRLTIIPLPKNKTDPRKEVNGPEAIRELVYSYGTYFKPPLEWAKETLLKSPRENGRFLLFFTDGAPEDVQRAEEMPVLAGTNQDAGIQALAFGLFTGDKTSKCGKEFLEGANRFLNALAGTSAGTDNFLAHPSDLVPAFTTGYAHILGSKPEAGELKPGAALDIDVGKYVVEVLVVTASTTGSKNSAYVATLTGPKGPSIAREGDNCAGGACETTRRHFAAFRGENEPDRPSKWTLRLDASAPGSVKYGVILRYDLTAEVTFPGPTVRADTAVPLRARLVFRGHTFDDETFFGKDDFKLSATVAGAPVSMTRTGGLFTGTWAADASRKGERVDTRATFTNRWIERGATTSAKVEGLVELDLRISPNPVELGLWRGDRSQTSRCQVLDLSGSRNADRVPVQCEVPPVTPGSTVTCKPVPGSERPVTSGVAQPLQWEVCYTAERCCGEARSAGASALQVRFSGVDPGYAAGAVAVPVHFAVEQTGLLRCWWPWLAAAAGALFLVWFIAGWVRPNAFEPSLSVRVSGSEAGLRRGTALVLMEQPGGKRGFYRNARMNLNSNGDCIAAPRLAMVVLEAGAGGSTRFVRATGLERKDKRTGKWDAVPADELATGHVPGVIHRAGNLYIKWE